MPASHTAKPAGALVERGMSAYALLNPERYGGQPSQLRRKCRDFVVETPSKPVDHMFLGGLGRQLAVSTFNELDVERDTEGRFDALSPFSDTEQLSEVDEADHLETGLETLEPTAELYELDTEQLETDQEET